MRWHSVGSWALFSFATACSSTEQPASPVAPAPVDASAPDGPAPCNPAAAYPASDGTISILATLPNLTFGEAAPSGNALVERSLSAYFKPCQERSSLLVMRIGGAWCGTCRWHAKHTAEFLQDPALQDRIEFLDVLIANEDNAPPDADAARRWQSFMDAPQRVVVDPDYRLGVINVAAATLPLFVLVDPKTMIAVNFLNNPDPELLKLRMQQELARLDKQKIPENPGRQVFDARFTRDEWDLLHEMKLPGAPPPDPTNAKADDAAAAAFGKKLFDDKTLSPTGTVSCASCHAPTLDLNDRVPQSTGGVSPLDRNSPAIALAAHARWQFWDGRADTLWMQALGPFENDKEFNSSRLFVAHAIYAKYKSEYEAIFGAMPNFSDTARFPPSGKPGTPAWQGMQSADRDVANRVFVNAGKAIAAFERTFRVKRSRFDDYLDGNLSVLTDAEKNAMKSFFVSGCAQCHWGPRLTNDAFHVIRFPTGRVDGQADRGRIDGVAQLAQSEFHAGSPYSDAPSMNRTAGLVSTPRMLGAFKTPPLRGLPGSAPYGHGGTLPTIEEVVRVYSTAGLDPQDPKSAGMSEPWLVRFDEHAQHAMPNFLKILTAEAIVP